MIEPLRMIVTGAGHWHAPRHIEAFTRAGVVITAVHDDDPAAAHRCGDALQCRVAPDLRDLLGTDANVVLAMPRHSDGPDTIGALVDRGLPFVVEKPTATSARAVLPFVEAVESAGQFAAVPFINRYSTFWEQLARLRANGLGEPPAVARFRIVNGPPSRYVDDGVAWVLDPAISGGGALRNLGPHTVDAFLSLATGQINVVGAALSHRQYALDVEEHAIALLRDEAGLVGTVEVGYSGPDVEGTDHEWALVGPGCSVRELHEVVGVITQEGRADFSSPSVTQRYRIFAQDVVDRLRAHRPPPATLRDAWRALNVVDRIYESARSTRAPNKETCNDARHP